MSVLLSVVVILCLILWFIFWPSNKGLSGAARFQKLLDYRRGGPDNTPDDDGYDDQDGYRDDDDHDDDHDGGGDNDD